VVPRHNHNCPRVIGMNKFKVLAHFPVGTLQPFGIQAGFFRTAGSRILAVVGDVGMRIQENRLAGNIPQDRLLGCNILVVGLLGKSQFKPEFTHQDGGSQVPKRPSFDPGKENVIAGTDPLEHVIGGEDAIGGVAQFLQSILHHPVTGNTLPILPSKTGGHVQHPAHRAD